MAAGPAHAWFRQFAASLVEAAIVPVGWDPKDTDGHLTVQLRSTLISLLARFSSSDNTVQEARRRYDAYVANPEDPMACPSDYRVSVLTIVLRAGGEEEFKKLQEMLVWWRCLFPSPCLPACLPACLPVSTCIMEDN